MTTPLICGSVVRNKSIEKMNFGANQKITNLSFDRKLRMMRADLFSLFSCTMDGSFIKKAHNSQILKKSLIKFLESEQNYRVQ